MAGTVKSKDGNKPILQSRRDSRKLAPTVVVDNTDLLLQKSLYPGVSMVFKYSLSKHQHGH